MGIITAKQLKQNTGEIIKRVRSGEHFTLTYRGKPVAIIEPALEKQEDELNGLRAFDEAWKSIEKTLEQTAPEFKSWKEAEDWIRGRR